MIQRIQTIWMLLAAFAIFCLFLVPSYQIQQANTTYQISAFGIKSNIDQTPNTNLLLILSVVMAGLISIINVFNFKNRTFQKRIAFLNILLLALLGFWIFQLTKQVPNAAENLRISLGAFLPPLAMLFTFLSIRGIQHDEKLIRSADRLR